MSGGFTNVAGSICNASDAGSLLASTILTSMNIGSGVYGAYTQITASCPVDCVAIIATCSFQSVPAYGAVWSIAIGAAGSEVSIATDMPLGPWDGSGGNSYFYTLFPLAIPAGTRVSMAAKGTSGDVVTAKLEFYDGDFGVGEIAGYDGIGNASVAPSASANTKGAWTPIAASTAKDYAGLMIGFDPHGATGGNFMFDIGIGAASSEIAIVNNIVALGNSSHQQNLYVPIAISKASRVSARCQTVNASAGGFPGVYLCGAYQ
jgi:hypothetical protein